MIVPEGLVVTIYKDDYFRGESWIVEGPKLVDFINGEVKGWNKEIRSLNVKKIS